MHFPTTCLIVAFFLWAIPSAAAQVLSPFLENNCLDCHDAETKKAGLDLSALAATGAKPAQFDTWVKVHDRVAAGEMPPKQKPRPDPDAQKAFVQSLKTWLVQTDRQRIETHGRATQRRLNRYEYENTLRDLLCAPWLQLRDSLPEDGEFCRFNKVGAALDISHVQMARYLSTADFALRQAMAPYADRPPTTLRRFYTRDQRSWTGPMKFSVFNTAPERATFPVLRCEGQPAVRRGEAPITVGADDPAQPRT